MPGNSVPALQEQLIRYVGHLTHVFDEWDWCVIMRFAVLLQGTLRGNGRQEKCELLATKVIEPPATRPAYSHCAIIEAPGDLPDGEYEVEFSGEIARTQRHGGLWTVGQTQSDTLAGLPTFVDAAKLQMGGPGTPIEGIGRGAASTAGTAAERKLTTT